MASDLSPGVQYLGKLSDVTLQAGDDAAHIAISLAIFLCIMVYAFIRRRDP